MRVWQHYIILQFRKQRPFNLDSASARLAQSVEHQTLNLRVVGSSPTLGEAFSDTHLSTGAKRGACGDMGVSMETAGILW